MTDHEIIREDAVQAIAGRLKNTGQVLSAWADVVQRADVRDQLLEHRLRCASEQLERAVSALDADENELARIDAGGPSSAGGTPPKPSGLRGRSEMISLVEFVGFLSSLGKDGVLTIQTPDGEFVVQLQRGEVVFASQDGTSAGARLGDLLLEQGALSVDELDAALDECEDGELLGEALLRTERVTPEQLCGALAHQAQQIFLQMHRVGPGFEFHFDEGSRVRNQPDVRLSITALLLEGARLKDEADARMAQARERMDALDMVFGEDGFGPEPPAENEEVADEPTSIRAAGDAANGGFEPESPASDPQAEVEAEELFRLRLAERIEEGDVALPAIPDSTANLLALCWNDDVDAEELAAYVSHDQALCAHILRVANSAAYAPVTPIESVQLAISRLGMIALRQIALTLTLEQKLFQVPAWKHVIRSLWRTASIQGGFGMAILRRCGGDGGRGSLIGLLQDVGKPMVLNLLCEIEKELELELDEELALQLMEEFHQRAGGLLVRQWSLPSWLEPVIRHHHDWEESEERDTDLLVGDLADRLASWAEEPGEEDFEQLADLASVSALGLDRDSLDALLAEAKRILQVADVYA